MFSLYGVKLVVYIHLKPHKSEDSMSETMAMKLCRAAEREARHAYLEAELSRISLASLLGGLRSQRMGSQYGKAMLKSTQKSM